MFKALTKDQRQQRLAFFRDLAAARGGSCLSAVYRGALQKLRWRCANAHEWKAKPSLVKRGTWCPTCGAISRVNVIQARKFEALRRIAKRRGGLCVSTEYVNIRGMLRWRCRQGHEWKAAAEMIDKGYWCPHCRRGRFVDAKLEHLRKLAKRRGGECRSNRYVNAYSPMEWRCAHGHRWRANATHILTGTWCPRCRGTRPDSLERMRRIARRHGGQCLSIEYVNSVTPLLWRCREGHEWHARPRYVVGGRWCWTCGVDGKRGVLPRRYSLDDMKEWADLRGGKCISTNYVNALTPIGWRCARGHEWEARPCDVRLGQWCRICAFTFVGTIDGMRAHARRLGGSCLSREYDDPSVPLRWQCARGHRFEAIASTVKAGVWCPRCTIRGAAKRRAARR